MKMKTIEDYINTLPQRLKQDNIEGWNSTFHFEVTGDDCGEWTISIADGKCQVSKGIIGAANCTVKMSDKTYIGIELGAVNPQIAFMMGKIKISNIGEMMKYIEAFNQLKKD